MVREGAWWNRRILAGGQSYTQLGVVQNGNLLIPAEPVFNRLRRRNWPTPTDKQFCPVGTDLSLLRDTNFLRSCAVIIPFMTAQVIITTSASARL
jgi:hypothetical protein